MGCGLSKAHIRPEVLVSHGNARLTVHGRRLIVDRHAAGWAQTHIAAAMGISRKCVRKWIDRYAAKGEAGLADRSSRPHTSPTRTAVEVEDPQRRTSGRQERSVRRLIPQPAGGLCPETRPRIRLARGTNHQIRAGLDRALGGPGTPGTWARWSGSWGVI